MGVYGELVRTSAAKARAEGTGFDPSVAALDFSSSWLTNVDGMKDLWCSSTVQLLSTQTSLGGGVDVFKCK